MRFVPTPIGPAPAWPSERPGGLDAGLLEAFLPAAGAEAALSALARPDALVVTTGQQPGLFTGPLYTIHKALSARALATLLSERWQRPVVPVFWLAGDDHDHAEAAHAAWLRPDGSVAQAELPPRPASAPQLPMYRTPLPPEFGGILETFAADLAPFECGPDVLAWVRRHWAPGRTIGAAYAGALAELLGRLGIVCFDSTHRAAKRAMARHLMKALGLAQDLDRDLAQRAAQLGADGRDGGVTVGDGASLVMLEGREGRDRLVVDGRELVTRRGGERFTLEQLQALAAREPERFSPNVLLRPVVEAAILPTVSYVAGPGELRYWALTPPVYDRMRVAPQGALPRWSGVIVEPRVERALDRFEVPLEEFLGPAGALERRVARGTMPPAAGEALAELRATVDRAYAELRREGGAIAPQLARALESLQRRTQWLTGEADRKFVAHLRRRDAEEQGQIRRGRDAVRPLGAPQERTLTVAPYIARYGPGILDELAAAILAWYRDALVGPPGTR
ncbi:MAG TPA: bacillithiol biosynthesis cysteine-adding enzyme BshC [Gemmatimonadales bacterium]|nr:bacillithiol biosynthesis cysteine-adding enzyme BshC [Gemmatimonadales bacterium]